LKFLHAEINKILTHGDIPQKARDRLIVPVPKPSGGYRPISLLTVFSKIVDRIIADRLKSLNLIRDCQFGCKEGHSAQHAVTRVLHHAGVAYVNDKQFAFLCLDFQKAYDRVNPFILLRKLATQGIPTYIVRYCLHWIVNRSFRVLHHGIESDEFVPLNGLPQGSPLSVILWLLFINDIDVDDDTSNIFMDDTAIWSSAETLEGAVASLKRKLHRVERWCIRNKVNLNHDKSGWLPNCTDPDLTLQIRLADGRVIPECKELKYLGVTLTSNASSRVLLFNHQPLVGKLRRLNSLLKRYRGQLSEYQLLRFCNALIQSKLNYFLPLMGMESPQLLHPLEIAWRETLRVITGALRSTPIPLLHHRSGLPPLKELIEEQAGRTWLQAKSALNNLLRDEYLTWNGVGDGWSPLGAHWRADEFLTPLIRQTEAPRHLTIRQLDILYKCKFNMASSKTAAMKLYNNHQLIPRDCELQLWTDGSFIETEGGAGWVLSTRDLIPLTKGSRGLRNVSSSYQCEQYASACGLHLLCKWIRKHSNSQIRTSPVRVAVLTDCRSLLQKLSSLPIRPTRVNKLCQELVATVEELNSLNVELVFTWIPGHADIGLNTLADELARDARVQDVDPDSLLTTKKTCHKLLRRRRQSRFKQWLFENVSDSKWEFAPPRDFAHAPRRARDMRATNRKHRRAQIQIFRIQTAHTQLRGHRCRFDKTVDSSCRLCHSAEETAMHVLLECPILEEELKFLRPTDDFRNQPLRQRYDRFHQLLRSEDFCAHLLVAIPLVNSHYVYF